VDVVEFVEFLRAAGASEKDAFQTVQLAVDEKQIHRDHQQL